MTVSPAADRQKRFSQRDVTLLVDMLRLSRVTLLIAERGADKSGVLQSAVIPLLQDRKQGSGEIVVLFDEWDKPPVPALHALVRQHAGAAGAAVPSPGAGYFISNLEAWQQALGRTFLIILDSFEDFLRAPRDAPGIAEFETAFAQIANDPTLRANFLVALDEDAEPLLANLRRYIPRLGYSSVRLPRPSTEGTAAADLKPAEDLNPYATLADDAQPGGMTAAGPPERSLTLVPAPPEPAAAVEKPREVPETPPAATGVPAGPGAAQTESHESTLGTETAEPEVKEPSPALMRIIAEIKQAMAELEQPASTVEAAKPAREASKRPPEVKAEVHSIGADSPDSAPAETQRLAGEETYTTHPRARTLDHGSPQKRFARVAWTLAVVIPAVAFLFWERQPGKPVDGNAAATAPDEAGKASEREASRAKPASSTPDRRPAPASAAAPAAGMAVAKAPPPAEPPVAPTAAEPTPAKTPRPVTPPVQAAGAEQTPAKAPAPVAPPAPTDAARAPAQAPASTAWSVSASNPSMTSAAKPAVKPAFSAQQDVRKPDAAAAKPPAAGPSTLDRRNQELAAAKRAEALPKAPPDERAPVPAAQPRDVPSKLQPAESAPSAAPARAAAVTTGSSESSPRSTAEPAVPVLRINVRNEDQRAWAKQLVGPLKERGIQVASIRMVPAHADGAHIRYYRGTDRNEAMRVAGALGELGLSARHLKQMDSSATATPRQYELWLSSGDTR